MVNGKGCRARLAHRWRQDFKGKEIFGGKNSDTSDKRRQDE